MNRAKTAAREAARWAALSVPAPRNGPEFDSPEARAARAELLNTWARVDSHGKPVACSRMRGEPYAGEGQSWCGNTNKIIFDTEGHAQRCADLMYAAGLAPRQEPYRCPRCNPGHRGHFHLTTTRQGRPARNGHHRHD